MSTEKAKENLKGLFNRCAMLCLPALPGTEGCGSRTSPPSVRTSRLRTRWTEMEQGDSLGKSKAGPSPTSEKTAAKRRKPSTKCPRICERGQISNRLISCAAVRKNRKDKWITFTPNLPKRIRVNSDKDLSSELGGRKCFAGPTNLWVFQYNTRNGSEWWLTGKIYDDACTETEGEGKTLCTRGFLRRQLDSLGTNQVTTMIPQSAHALTPPDMWSSL